MTALVIARRRLSIGLAGLRLELLALLLVLAAGAGAAVIAWGGPGEAAVARPVAATVQLTSARAAALVAATSASPEQVRAIGEEAKLINAALPFSGAPVQAAQPFDLSDDPGLNHRRALLCLTQAVYYEAGFEPVTGRRAVAQVVLNRMRHPAFPKSVCGVVYQGSRSPVCQFSFVCDGSLTRAPAASAWRQAHEIAAAALAGQVESSVGGATHYHANYVAPYWAPKLHKITQMGAHIFYRWPGAWGLRGAFTGRYIGEPNDPAALRPATPAATMTADGEVIPGSGPAAVEAGPAIARAPNDVGGLLDTSKGWTLSIPDPRDIGGAAARALAEQKVTPPTSAAPSVPIATSAAPILVSR